MVAITKIAMRNNIIFNNNNNNNKIISYTATIIY